MAFTHVTLKNEATGEIKNAPVGWSWTTWLFGCFPALFRGDFVGALFLIIAWALSFIGTPILTMIVGSLAAAVYNRSYIARMQQKGFVMSGMEDLQIRFNGLSDSSLFKWYGREARNTLLAILFNFVIFGLAFLVVGASIAAGASSYADASAAEQAEFDQALTDYNKAVEDLDRQLKQQQAAAILGAY